MVVADQAINAILGKASTSIFNVVENTGRHFRTLVSAACAPTGTITHILFGRVVLVTAPDARIRERGDTIDPILRVARDADGRSWAFIGRARTLSRPITDIIFGRRALIITGRIHFGVVSDTSRPILGVARRTLGGFRTVVGIPNTKTCSITTIVFGRRVFIVTKGVEVGVNGYTFDPVLNVIGNTDRRIRACVGFAQTHTFTVAGILFRII